MKCEKCGFEMEQLKIRKFGHNGSDYEWHEPISWEMKKQEQLFLKLIEHGQVMNLKRKK